MLNLTDEQYTIGLLRFIIDQEFMESMYEMDMADQSGNLEVIEKEISVILNEFNSGLETESESKEIWDNMISDAKINGHNGDCVNIPKTCNLCLIEKFVNHKFTGKSS